MWYKILFALLLFSCKRIESNELYDPIDLTIGLLSPTQQESFSVMKSKFTEIFRITPAASLKCSLDLSITQQVQSAGITSTAFASSQTLILTTFYAFKCNNKWKMEKSLTLTNEFTQQQDKTVGQYVAEKYFLQEISKRMAQEIYDDISLYIILEGNKANNEM
jgi:hypothetical protein